MTRTSERRPTFLLAAAAFAVTTALSVSVASAQGADQVMNGSFDAGTAPWWWTANSPAGVVDGQLCATVPAGTVNPWDAIIGQNDIPLISGESYSLTFTASATAAVSVRANVQLADPPFTPELSRPVSLGSAPQQFSFTFTSLTDTPAGQVAFQIGGAAESWSFCMDDVSLIGGVPPPVFEPDTATCRADRSGPTSSPTRPARCRGSSATGPAPPSPPA